MSSFDVDFTTTTDVYSTPFNNFWGNSSQMSLSSAGLLFGSGPTNDYSAMGLMVEPTGASAGEGYGVFSFIARHQEANQPGGCYLLLWRADNNWLMSADPGMITEMDMWETFDNSAHIFATTHFWSATASGNDGYTEHQISTDPTKLHVATYVWAKGSLEYYFDETLIFSVTGATVPDDFSDGGCNQCMGVGAETETSPVGMYVTYANYVAEADIAAAGGVPAILAALVAKAGGTSTSAPTTPTTPAVPPVAYTISNPGTVTGTAPVVCELAVTGPDNGTAYWVAVGPAPNYTWGGNPVAVTLSSSGKATIGASLVDGGFVKLGSDPALDNLVSSEAVTIVAPTTGSGSSSGSGASNGSGESGTPVAGAGPTTTTTTSGSSALKITAAQQTGTTLKISFIKATGGNATLDLSVQTASTGMTPIGTYWDNCPDGTQTLEPVDIAVPADLTAIELTVRGTATVASFTMPASATTTGTTAPGSSAYSWATLSTAVVAALGSSGSSASVLTTIEAVFASYQKANPGK